MESRVFRENKKFWMFSLTGMLLIITTSGFARMSYGLVLPYMQKDLALSISQAGILGTTMFLGYLLTVGLSGLLALRFGAKSVLIGGATAVLVSMIGLAWASSFLWVSLFMFISGAGSALVFTPLMSVMISWFPNKKGMALGIILSGAGIGMLLSGILIPIIIKEFSVLSWRAVWIFFGIVSLIVLVIATITLKNPVEEKNLRAKDEKVNWMKNKELTKIAVLYFLLGIAYLIPNLYQSSYMLNQGFDNKMVGIVYAVAGVFSIAGGPLWGSISDKMGTQKTLLVAWIFGVLGDIIPIVFTNSIGFVVSAIIWGSSIGGLVTLIQVKASEQVSQKYVSTVIGFISVFYAIGQMLGPAISGAIIEYAGGFDSAYGFGALVYFLGIILTLYLKKGTE